MGEKVASYVYAVGVPHFIQFGARSNATPRRNAAGVFPLASYCKMQPLGGQADGV